MSGFYWDWSWGRPVISLGVMLIIFLTVFIIWLCKRKERLRKRREIQEKMKERPINQANLNTRYT